MEQKGAGWIAFAWIMLVVVGCWNVIEGILAIARSSQWVEFAGSYSRVTAWDYKTWGWIVLIWGLVVLGAAASVARGGQYGRWFGILAASIAIILQFFFLPAAPLWSLILIALYAMVLFGLAAYGGTHERLGG